VFANVRSDEGSAQGTCSVSITPSGIIPAMKDDEVPTEMKSLIADLDKFAKS
jgi:hypothetical protein